MKPHDRAVRPGAHLVAAELGIDDSWDLINHPPHDPLGVVGRMVATAAHEVDDLHGDLVRAAQAAIDLLQPISQGKNPGRHGTYGALNSAGPHLDLLAARRGSAYEYLVQAVSAYRRLLPEAVETASDGLGPAPKRAADHAPGRDDDWAIAGDRQAQALRAVERGGLRLKQSALSEQDRYLSDGTGVLVPIWAQTVERMLADGLLEIDTATKPTQGQLLSLTPLGQEALHAADDDTATATAAGPEPAPRDTAGPEPAPHDAANAVQAVGGSGPAAGPLPTREELLALEEIKGGRVLLKERALRSGLRVETGSGAPISTATVEAMQERGWVERDTGTSLNLGRHLSVTDSGETAFRAGSAQQPRTTAALSRSTRNNLPSSAAQPSAAGAPGRAKPTRNR